MRIVITGGLGYVGSVLLSNIWSNPEYDIVVLDDCRSGGLSYVPYMEHLHLQTNTLAEGKIPEIVASADVLIHLAATVGFPACQKNVEESYKNNTALTKALCESVNKNCHVIFASTTSVYGNVDGANEESICFAPSEYAKQKLIAEQYVKTIQKYTILRFSTAFGLSPNFRQDLLPHTLVISALKQKYIALFESGAVRSFVHVNDMAECINFAIEEQVYGTFNIGSNNNQITKKDLAVLIQEYTGCSIFEGSFGNDPEQRFNQVCYDKAVQAGFPINTSLRKGVRALIKYAPIYLNERTE